MRAPRREGRAEGRDDAALAALIGLGLAAVFWAGRSRSFGPGDSAEHVFSALLWDVPRSPGYPLQTALGWLWSRGPWADPGAAVNGLSGILSAAAAAVLFLLLRRAGARRAAALTGAALMALSPLFWYYSLVAEVRALNDLLALAAAYFAQDWSRRGRPRSWLLFCVAAGFGLSHHPTFLLLAPAFAVWILARRVPARLAVGGACLAAAALAAPYLLLGLRLAHSAPPYDLFEIKGWADLPGLFLRKDLGGPLRMASGAGLGPGGVDLGRLAAQAGWFAGSLWTHVGPVGLGLAAAGAAALRRGARRELAGWALWLALAAGAPVVFGSQQLLSPESDYIRAVATRFHLLPLIAVFALAGLGAEALARRVRPAFSWALAGAVLLLPLTLRPLSLAGSDPLLDYTRGLIRDSRPKDLIVLASDDTIFAALDLTLARGEGRDRVFLVPALFGYGPYLRRLRRDHPGLVLPLEPRGLSLDWSSWKRRNPGRAVLLESSLRDAALARYPRSVPQGSLIRIEERAAPAAPAADARRFLDMPEVAAVTRWSVRPWTQEVYLLDARRRMAEWLATRLDPRRDAALDARLRALVFALQVPGS